MRIAVLVSGSGTNLQAIIDAIDAGKLDAEIVCVVSSNEKAYGIQRARKAGITTVVFMPADYTRDPVSVDCALVKLFNANRIDYIVMAGYMRKVTPVLLDAYPNHIVNLHPALLPAHVGAHAIQDAYDAGDEVTGITFHFANAEYDQGPIIFQYKVPRLQEDSLDDLEARIHKAEHEYYPKVLQLLAEGRVKVIHGTVVFDGGNTDGI